jgi:DNA-binding transcriptional LysR family regulator
MSLEAIDLNLVLVLHHVLAEGTVARAAERLHVTPSAVSNSLARLRRLLGDPLFVRRGRTVVPTPLARELAPQVATTVERLRVILEAQRTFNPDACTRSFTLASADNIGILPAIATRFAQSLPRASLRVVTLDHALASDGLASGDIDVLLGLPPTIRRDIRSEPAYTDRLVCAMWRKCAPTGRRLTLKRFLEARHVEVALQGKHAIDYVDGVLSRLGHRRSIALSVPQFALAAGCVIGTPYITMLPASMAKGLASALPLAVHRPPFALPAITILQLWHARSDADPGSILLRAIIRRVGREARV